MTLNSKVLSLVLLAGLTMGGTYAKKQKTDWNNDSHSVKWSDEKCNAATNCSGDKPTTDKFCDKACCSTFCDDDCAKSLDSCTDCTQPRCFRAYLSSANVVQNTLIGSTTISTPHKFLDDEDKACGQVDLCFDKFLSKVCYRITICNVTCTGTTIPSSGTVVFSCLSPEDAPSSTNALADAAFFKDVTASSEGKICFTGSFDQKKLNDWQPTVFNRATAAASCLNFIPSIYQACMNFSFTAIYIPTTASRCSSIGRSPSCDLSTGGCLRGTFIPCLPKCGN